MTTTIDWLFNPDDEDSVHLPFWCDLTSWWIAEFPNPDEQTTSGWLVAGLAPIQLPPELATSHGTGIPLNGGWNFWLAGDREALTDLVVAIADWTCAAIVIDLAEGGFDAIADITDDLRKDLAL